MLSVIVPTIFGREESLERTVAGYCETLEGIEHEIIVIRNVSTWPGACNKGYQEAQGDVLHFGADDLVPLPGWHEDVLDALRLYDELPAARVLNYSADGEFDNIEDGADRAIVQFTRVPILRRDQYERIGFWPRLDYYADMWLSDAGRRLGMQTRIYYSYAFVHHWHQTGRKDDPKTLAKAWRQYQNVRRKTPA